MKFGKETSFRSWRMRYGRQGTHGNIGDMGDTGLTGSTVLRHDLTETKPKMGQ